MALRLLKTSWRTGSTQFPDSVRRSDRMLKWRRSVEAKFVFDPSKGIDSRDIAKVEQDILSIRIKTMTDAKAAHAEAVQAQATINNSKTNDGTSVKDLAGQGCTGQGGP